MKKSEQVAIKVLRLERGRWRRAVKRLRAGARDCAYAPAWRALYAAAAAQILSWRREALKALRSRPPFKNPLSRRAAAVIRREYLRVAGDGIPQAAAWAIAYRYAQRRGLVE